MNDENQSKTEPIINIRKLAALDIVFHGPRLIFIEFAGASILCGAFGVFSLYGFVRNPDHPLFTFILGLFLSCIALNYVPLLLYAIAIVRRHSAQAEVAFELEHKNLYVRKYTFQSLLLLVPFAVPILAILQERQKAVRVEPSDRDIT